LRFKNSA
jgi:hypothetical protein